ncbi:MAG: DUF4912 domain-containing protein [Methylovulum sp.]|nr:DUF4912 domain-containing protein [Methylovulum sp.]
MGRSVSKNPRKNEHNGLKQVMTFSRSGYDTQIKLSSEELCEISQEISHKFAPNVSNLPPDFTSPPNAVPNSHFRQESAKSQISSTFYSSHHSGIQLSPQEIFEISQEISHKFAPCASTGSPELVLLPVDPYHLYAYWNLGGLKGAIKSKDEPDSLLVLRIYWRPDENTGISNTKIWFDVALDNLQSGQKVRLPIDGTAYSAVIGRPFQGNNLTVFAGSNIIHVPCDKLKPLPIQRAPVRHKEPLPVARIIPHPALQDREKPLDSADVFHYEETLPNAGAANIWYEKIYSKQARQERNRDNEILFFSRLKNMLSENDAYGEPIPKTNASEVFYCKNDDHQNKNVSGQGK